MEPESNSNWSVVRDTCTTAVVLAPLWGLVMYQPEHYGIYTRPLTVKLILLKEGNFECLDIV